MLQIEGFLAGFAWALIGFVVVVSLNPEDKRDGGLMLLLSAVTLGASLYAQNPAVALALQVLLGLQALVVIGWFVRVKLRRR